MKEELIKNFVSNRDYTWKEKIYDKGKYIGQFSKDKREGKGIMYYNDGSVNFGEWKYNYFQSGKMISPQNDIFEGKYSDEKSLTGICHAHDGSIIYGSWVYGKLFGHATKIFPENHPKGCIKFSGLFNNDLPNGIGMLTTKHDLYYGIWENGKQIADYRDIDNSLENVTDRTRQLIIELICPEPELFSFSKSFTNDYKASKQDLQNIFYGCEGEFGILIKETETEKIENTNQLIELIMKKLSELI
ncbi:MAG: hypothetical protein MJ211_03665 [Bacteroidales bacterium]|nr:hypothetical protein [Bacteroidales bacterium]